MLKLYRDGSIVRTDDFFATVPPSEQPVEEDSGVATRDVVIDPTLGVWVRLHLPGQRSSRLPILVYFHGGGFCFVSPAVIDTHRFCSKWAAALCALIVSVNYRLAPEHRLPAAYDDSVAAMDWVRSESIKKRNGEAMDPWLNSFADFSNVFLMGDSAGGNIVHHLIMRMGELQGWNPLQIRGALLLQPFFGGKKRTQSEMKCPETARVSLSVCDRLWRMALPIGADRNHPFSNPFCPKSLSLSKVVFPPLLVSFGGKDCLSDRCLQYCEALKKCGKQVELIVFDEEEHGFHSFKLDCESSKKVMEHAALFVASSCSLPHWSESQCANGFDV
eukprot:Gb_12886 [translate_table: standard]